MSTFKTYLKILSAHKAYIAIYLVMMSALGVVIGLMSGTSTAEEFRPTSVSVAVIDRDNTELSQALAVRVANGNNVVEVADERRAIQDAVARDTVSYLLVIPQGWGDGLLDAAAGGTDAPSLETYISYQSGRGRLLDLEVTSYANALYGNAATLGGNAVEIVDATDAAWEESAETSIVQQATTPLPESLHVAAEFASYPLFASVTVCIAVLMASINQEPVLRRRLASPEHARNRSLSLLAACVTVALVAWAWNFGLQIVVLGADAVQSSPVQMALMGFALLVYSLVSAAAGFLVGQLGCSENASNAIANIFGMLLSFLGGAWTGLAILPDSIIAIAHFVPSYWTERALEGAAAMGSVSLESVTTLLGDIGICALFGVAVLLVGMAVGRSRGRTQAA
ncbi:ABC transporter permease [Olsenella sp. Marseille-P4559]|uniref:ABC transporter permease n=1 Tax=Olsenella sp. Marseille-P4559 TaxID=2364795 RepID=UPI0010309F27|nr:ABC transporter permease [Olsenella sp. Marseille-P4559]